MDMSEKITDSALCKYAILKASKQHQISFLRSIWMEKANKIRYRAPESKYKWDIITHYRKNGYINAKKNKSFIEKTRLSSKTKNIFC